MNIVYVFSDGLAEYNSSNFRVSYIADALRRAGHKVNLINIQQWSRQTEECKAICSRADIIHLQRVSKSLGQPYV
jgi:tRNA U34 2-thiouridine synthase MnmA/TrmU